MEMPEGNEQILHGISSLVCKYWDSPPKNPLNPGWWNMIPTSGVFFSFVIIPKYMSMFNSIHLIHHRSYLLNGGTLIFFGGGWKFLLNINRHSLTVWTLFPAFSLSRYISCFRCLFTPFFSLSLKNVLFSSVGFPSTAAGFQEDLLGAVWKWGEGLGMGQWRYQKDLPTSGSTLASSSRWSWQRKKTGVD